MNPDGVFCNVVGAALQMLSAENVALPSASRAIENLNR